MAVSVSMPLKFLSLTLILFYFAISCCLTVYAQENPVAAASRAFYCFNNKFVSHCALTSSPLMFSWINNSEEQKKRGSITLSISKYYHLVTDGNARFRCTNINEYKRCGEEYRLDQSGYVNVPSYATDDYCHGPCLSETQSLLNCIDDMFSNFLFLNRATVPDIRNTLRAGCSYTAQRGIFNVGNYIGRGINGSDKLHNSVSFYVLMLATLACCFLLN